MGDRLTIKDIYIAINPLPAALSAKGKTEPEVALHLEANAGISILLTWRKRHSVHSYDREYKTFFGDSFDHALEKAAAFIGELPSEKQARLHDFMASLGKLIDAGKSDGIDIDYMNPLIDTMKRLSENVITFQPGKTP